MRNRLDRLAKKYEAMDMPPSLIYTFKDGHKEKHIDDSVFMLEHKGEIIDVTPPPLDDFLKALGTETISELWQN